MARIGLQGPQAPHQQDRLDQMVEGLALWEFGAGGRVPAVLCRVGLHVRLPTLASLLS